MKFIFTFPYIKLHNEIHNTAQNCTKKCATCWAIKKNQISLCFCFARQAKNKVYMPS